MPLLGNTLWNANLYISSVVFSLSCCASRSLLSLSCWLMLLELPWALCACAAALTTCVCVLESSGHFLVLLLSFICHIWMRCCRHRTLHQAGQVDDASVHQQKGLLLLWQHLSAQLVSLSEELVADTWSLSCAPCRSGISWEWWVLSCWAGSVRCCVLQSVRSCILLPAPGYRKVHVPCSSARG